MKMRLGTLLVVSLAAIQDVSAAVVIHELSGVVSVSQVPGVVVGDPFVAVLTYDTDQPDLFPDDVSRGKYSKFTLSLDVGLVSVSQTNPVRYNLLFTSRAPGSSGDQMGWFGINGITHGDIGLRAFDPTGTALASDALPTSLDGFEWATIRHPVADSIRIDGSILSISSRIVPEPTSLAILAITLPGILLRRFTALWGHESRQH